MLLEGPSVVVVDEAHQLGSGDTKWVHSAVPGLSGWPQASRHLLRGALLMPPAACTIWLIIAVGSCVHEGSLHAQGLQEQVT